MKTIEIETSWHKSDSKDAMTYKQYEFIMSLATDENLDGWGFKSTTNAMRSLTKFDASEIIDALKNGCKVVIL